MSLSTRKERQRREREDLILEHASDLFAEEGYLGFNLDRLAERVEYSKATLYNHFLSKEDLLAAVANRQLQERAELFSKALLFDGKTRERMCCVGAADEILSHRHQASFELMQLARAHSIWEKVSATTQQRFESGAKRCFQVASELVNQGRRAGDLPRTEEELPTEQVVAGLVAISRGTFLLSRENSVFKVAIGKTAADFLFDHYDAYLDGLGWRPLSTEWDYATTRQRARAFLSGMEGSKR